MVALEPRWLKVRKVRLGTGPVRHRFAQITDIHYRGDADYLREVVAQVDALAPDFVCFTGDLIEEAGFVAPALEILGAIRAPLYGIPGNHDHWSRADFGPI
ncbi:MAG: metallophosphoesterase, partial [Verrucomicrobiota bacterium]